MSTFDDSVVQFPGESISPWANGSNLDLGAAASDGLHSDQSERTEGRIPSMLIAHFDAVGDVSPWWVGGKAANLAKLRRAGLPVPPGYVISTEAHEAYLGSGRLPEGLVKAVIAMKHALGGNVAIRSSANLEDGDKKSMAGVFTTFYVYGDDQVGPAIEQIYTQAHSAEVAQSLALHGMAVGDVRMALIVQELIEPEVAGVMYTGVNGNDVLVQCVKGFGSRLVDGKTHGMALLIRDTGIISQSTGFEVAPLAPAAIQQLHQHARLIQQLFPEAPQDIEFAIRGGELHILQARPLTTELGQVSLDQTPEDCLAETKTILRQLVAEEKAQLGTETAVFSDSNYSELLPRPTAMDIGIYMYIHGGSDGIPAATHLARREMGYQVGDEANGIIKFIGGRTYFSIARNAAIYYVGFPATKAEYFATLVKEYLEAVQADPGRGAYPQMGLYLQDPTLADLRSRYGEKAEEYFQIYQEFTARMARFADEFITQFETTERPHLDDFTTATGAEDLNAMTNAQLADHADKILEHLRTRTYVNFAKAARLGFYYSQRLQTLLQSVLGYTKEQAEAMYSELDKGLDGSALTDANVAIAEAGSEKEATQLALKLVGHYSTGEMLEIRHPPLRDAPDQLLEYVRGIRQSGHYKADHEHQKAERLETQSSLLSTLPPNQKPELEKTIHSSQTYMALRETVKYLFTKEYLLLRDTLELLGARLGLENGAIYFLYPREIPRFVQDPQSMLHLIRSRTQAFANYNKLDLPHVIREQDIDGLDLKREHLEEFESATGIFLANGTACEGVVVNLDEFSSLAAVDAAMAAYRQQNLHVILVATQMNLSHDPLIEQADGLVIENAGIVAHCAQRARDLGKGAIGGIDVSRLPTGMRVKFDPVTRTVKKIQ